MRRVVCHRSSHRAQRAAGDDSRLREVRKAATDPFATRGRPLTPRADAIARTTTPSFVGRAVVPLAQDPDVSRWSGKSLSSGQLATIYGFTDLDGSQPDAWRYLREVQDAGKPADVSGSR
jgi:hypothetical protein